MSGMQTPSAATAGVVRLPLSLRISDGEAHPAAAWLIPGGDAAGWIEEIAAWNVPAGEIALYPVPGSIRDRTCVGVLAIPPAGTTPAASPRAQGYRCLGGVLYLPAAAEVDPPLSDDEIRSLFPWAVAVFHPSIGAIGFTRGDALSIADLLASPNRHEEIWDRAAPGVAPPPRLVSVEAEVLPNFEVVLDEGRGDISSQSPEDVPSETDEAGKGDAAGSPLASLLKWFGLGGKKPGDQKPEGGGLFSGIIRWFRPRPAPGPDVEAARRRELERLMRLLETDPDAGLRYALPLTGAGSRGIAPPSGQLPPREVNFTITSLGRGKPADPWKLAEEVRQRLQQQYRDAASRELRLGRHRRAAYVFAKLLGDYNSAANALKQGRHFREAAVLYREKLNDSASAATCLEEGGLLTEAIEIYVSLDQFEKAGDLYAQIDRPDAAADCWQKAVHQRIGKGDYVGAAKLWETKLAAIDNALYTLREGWPNSAQAAACLRAEFELLGRVGRHEVARGAIAAAAEEAGDRDVVKLVDVLAGVSASYPNPAVRRIAADTARVAAGRRLPTAESLEATSLIGAVTRLDTADRLLARDGNRFLAARARIAKPKPSPPAKSPTGARLLRTFHLGRDVQWKAATSHEDQFVAMGLKDGKAVIVGGNWEGEDKLKRVEDDEWYRCENVWLQVLPDGRTLTVNGLCLLGQPLAGPDGGGPIGTPSFLRGADCRGMACDEYGGIWAVIAENGADDNLSLKCYGSGGELKSSSATLLLTLLDAAPPGQNILLAARGGNLLAGYGKRLRCHVAKTGGRLRLVCIDLPAAMTGLAVTFPMTLLRACVTFAEGAMVVWPESGISQRFGDGLFDPLPAFLRTSHLVVVGREEGRVYQTTGDHKIDPLGRFYTGSTSGPLAVLAAGKLAEFAVISADGEVRVFSATTR